jgi:glycosyltransferase involved in cell wall biosynthesis
MWLLKAPNQRFQPTLLLRGSAAEPGHSATVSINHREPTMATKIAFVTYETQFAPAGGVKAVMERLPSRVKAVSGLQTIILTPFHHQIKATTSASTSVAGNCKVTYQDQELGVSILRHDTDLPWYFLKPDSSLFFGGTPHPYLVGKTWDEIARNLLRDSLVFGSAVARALVKIDAEAQWIVMMQDWEAATSALALSNHDHSNKLFLTLHNSYDSPATNDDLGRHGIKAHTCPGITILNRAIPLVEKTIFTVSDQFAADLTEDDFQAKVMADHLTDLLRPRLHGVNNGPFAKLEVDPEALATATRGDYAQLADWKAKNRGTAIAALSVFTPTGEKPIWGDLARFDKDPTACWFVMAGRDDTRQKGYDIGAAAIKKFLENGGKAQFFFFPIPGDEGLAGLYFLRKLANSFPQNVIGFPFRWEEGFAATLRGASFGLMPSLYEPFGMANEFYLSGTVGIGRATGGIVQQIVPLQGAACFSHAAQLRAARWHSSSSNPTGLLFRERDGVPSCISDWRSINTAAYNIGEEFPDRLIERNGGKQGNIEYKGYELFRAMSHELCLALGDSVRLFHHNKGLYYKLLTEGVGFIQRGFSWERASHEYLRNVRTT